MPALYIKNNLQNFVSRYTKDAAEVLSLLFKKNTEISHPNGFLHGKSSIPPENEKKYSPLENSPQGKFASGEIS